MSSLTISSIPAGTKICNGKQLTFKAPCDCTGIDSLIIKGETYALVDSMGEVISSGGYFCKDSMVTVVLDTVNKRVYLQTGSRAHNLKYEIDLAHVWWDIREVYEEGSVLPLDVAEEVKAIVRKSSSTFVVLVKLPGVTSDNIVMIDRSIEYNKYRIECIGQASDYLVFGTDDSAVMSHVDLPSIPVKIIVLP